MIIQNIFNFRSKNKIYFITMIIKIHSKYYDISKFKDLHPGGPKILESSEGIDATAAFESYHAFSDMTKINSIMKKYEIDEDTLNEDQKIKTIESTFNKNGFYDVVKSRAINYFNNNTYKWTYPWLFYLLLTFSLYILSFLFTFLATDQPFIYRIISCILSATCMICSMFQGYHDATHFAVSKNRYVNYFISLLGSAFAFWDWTIWMKHHCVLHHSFTGNYKLDPDTRHTHPFFKKSIESKAKTVSSASMISVVLSLLPGMYLGQIIAYLNLQITKKIWGFKINYRKSIIEWFILISQFYLMFHGKSIILVLLFFLTLNIHYSIAILPDHDQLETRLNSKSNTNDWGEMQVRHSGNFAMNNLFYTRLYGGINYQIEHHLFPSVCSYHLPYLSDIVRQTCSEFKIGYITNPSIYSSYISALKNMYLINNTEIKED